MLARIWAVLFIALAVLFAVGPDYTLNYLTDIGRGLFGWFSPKAMLGEERFWLVPTIAFLVAMSYSSLLVQKDPRQYAEHTHVIIIALFLASAGFATCLHTQGLQFFYVAGAAVSFVLFAITFAIYHSAARSRSRWAA